MPLELDRARIDTVVRAVADRLKGDWLLVGGGLVALWLEPRRVTEDVDIVGIRGSAADRLDLLGLARELGLPIEALNSAADFFVYRVADWREQIEVFWEGAQGRIYRPSGTLFLLLKIHRLSARDLDDCIALMNRVAGDGSPLDVPRVVQALDGLPPAQDAALGDRRARLRSVLTRGLPPSG